MDYAQAIILALIQGITEFLPISSSAHLILPITIFDWPDQGLAFDTAVHLGSLFAVLLYFRTDIFSLSSASLKHMAGKASDESRFAINLIIASLPIIVAGLLLKDIIENELRGVHVIAITTVVFGLLLYVADKSSKLNKTDQQFNVKDALAIGLAQCFALIPGTSRSGATITIALLLGYNREHASRISFLLSIPAIGGAATLKTLDLIQSDTAVEWQFLITGLVISCFTAYACIHFFLAFINRIGFTPFVIYRLLLGAGLFWLVS